MEVFLQVFVKSTYMSLFYSSFQDPTEKLGLALHFNETRRIYILLRYLIISIPSTNCSLPLPIVAGGSSAAGHQGGGEYARGRRGGRLQPLREPHRTPTKVSHMSLVPSLL